MPALGEIASVSPANGYALTSLVVTLTGSNFGGSGTAIGSIGYSSDDGTFSSTCTAFSYTISEKVSEKVSAEGRRTPDWLLVESSNTRSHYSTLATLTPSQLSTRS